jgi:predicted Fe-Mo cluster-binding NifX family protein
MKFAVPLAEGKLATHFGHCKEFAFVNVEDGEISGTEIQIPPPHEPGVLPKWLGENGVNIVIAGGMGARAVGLLRENQIEVQTGAPSLEPEILVRQYLNNELVTGQNLCDH